MAEQSGAAEPSVWRPTVGARDGGASGQVLCISRPSTPRQRPCPCLCQSPSHTPVPATHVPSTPVNTPIPVPLSSTVLSISPCQSHPCQYLLSLPLSLPLSKPSSLPLSISLSVPVPLPTLPCHLGLSVTLSTLPLSVCLLLPLSLLISSLHPLPIPFFCHAVKFTPVIFSTLSLSPCQRRPC